jgi:hypothetical protein
MVGAQVRYSALRSGFAAGSGLRTRIVVAAAVAVIHQSPAVAQQASLSSKHQYDRVQRAVASDAATGAIKFLDGMSVGDPQTAKEKSASAVQAESGHGCPPNAAAAVRWLQGSTVIQEWEYTGGEIGRRDYDVSRLNILGTRPKSVEAHLSGSSGGISSLEIKLPDPNLRSYAPAFRAAYPRGGGDGTDPCTPTQDPQACDYRPRPDTWNMPSGSLTGARLRNLILDRSVTYLICEYR